MNKNVNMNMKMNRFRAVPDPFAVLARFPLLPRPRIAALMLVIGSFAQAYPPAPHHTIYGMIRDEWGNPIPASSATVLLEAAPGTVIVSEMSPDVRVDANYRIHVPMDAGKTPDLYKPSALWPVVPYKIKVRIGDTVYLPMEMLTDFAMGNPSEKTRLDLTLGEDLDHDGMPDAWERALIAAAGGELSLEDIQGGGDFDGDGIRNLDEYLAGTYAFDPEDGFSLKLRGLTNGNAVLEFLSIRGRTYSIEASSNLVDWEPVEFQVEDDDDATDPPLRRSYRAADVRRVVIGVPPRRDGPAHRYFRAIVH